ncbi:MAG: Hsp20/alpha crystallin family protein [Candidatus Helarchaeota archaeon]|nr:Hsp20/alpha crystallin family protein [Candidatus Helarchaeota archaeon]
MSEENNKKMKIMRHRKSIFDLYDDLFADMERKFRDMFSLRTFSPSWDDELCCLQPLIDYRITKDEVILTADLPNVDKSDVEINVTEDSIEIEAKMKSEIKFEKWGTESFQKNFQYFHKSLKLPVKINTDDIKADFKKGILQINAPIKRTKKKVEIE